MSNPVIRTTRLASIPWVIRQYQDGTYDAAHVNRPAVSPALDCWHEAFVWAKAEAYRRDPMLAVTRYAIEVNSGASPTDAVKTAGKVG